MKKQGAGTKIVLYLILMTGLIASLFPLYWMFKSSLVSMKDIFALPDTANGLLAFLKYFLPKNPSLDNYKKALTAFPFDRFFLNSLFVTALTVIGTVFTSSICAYSFSRLRWKWRDRTFLFILSGIMVTFVVVMIPQFILYNTLGLIDTFAPLILPAWFGGGAYNIFLLRQFFLSIPRELDEAARIDGAGYFRTYAQIIVPCAKQSLIVVALLSFLNSWNEFLQPVIFINTESRYTLMLGLNLFISSYTSKWEYMMAVSTVVIIPSIALYVILQRYFVQGITMTGVKA